MTYRLKMLNLLLKHNYEPSSIIKIIGFESKTFRITKVAQITEGMKLHGWSDTRV